MATTELRINLTSDVHRSAYYEVQPADRYLTVTIDPDIATFSGTSWVAELEWSADAGRTWNSFAPARITFSNTKRAAAYIALNGITHVSLIPTTRDATADENALVTYHTTAS